MSSPEHSIVPKPLNPRDPEILTRRLSPGDSVRITTTDLPRTILTVRKTNPPTSHAPQLVLTAPPITTTAQDELQQATFHCTASHADSAMTVIEYIHTARDTSIRCIGTLTTIAHLPRLSTPVDDRTAKAEVSTNE
ncbi:hypothetical protein SAMN05421858_4294 [Haladaptatus litoreus]|uniref:Uncharacterized protein n=1 Tax=Haladaptatus litoreus TaxID=553468 RepID=A0A1N7EJ29_9EURY|nr:hypothetical protein [Haladaptatus litoreus]SIR88029.1 hypothetical protein SAMN05421858_4294 [Haladaptatus litoreus]